MSSVDGDTGFLYEVGKIPCFKQAHLTGILTGLVIGLHRFYRIRTPQSMVRWTLFGYAIVAPVTWQYCRFNLYKDRDEASTALRLQSRRLPETVLLDEKVLEQEVLEEKK